MCSKMKIYNSRNYSILLNITGLLAGLLIYNSRNYSILLNCIAPTSVRPQSTTVEIILYYLTNFQHVLLMQSTTVEIILYYLTPNLCICTIFWSQATLFLLFYITFAQYMLSNIDYYKIKLQVCITL